MSRSGWSFSRVSTRKWSRVDLLSLHRKLTLATRTHSNWRVAYTVDYAGKAVRILNECSPVFCVAKLGKIWNVKADTLLVFARKKMFLQYTHKKLTIFFIIYRNKMTYLPVFMILPMRRIISKSFPNFLDFLTWEKLISLISVIWRISFIKDNLFGQKVPF